MIRPILTLALIAMTLPAVAAPFNFVERFTPPPEFDHEPSVSYTITEVPILKIGGVCAILNRPVYGCVIGSSIYLRADLTPARKDIILRHEKAHVNGWRHE